MTIKQCVFATPGDLGAHLAAEIADAISAARETGRRFVLGCPGGRSPRPTYQALARIVGERGMALSHLTVAMMDEYVLPDGSGRFRPVDRDAHYSVHRFAVDEIVAPLSAAATDGDLDASALWFPDPADPADYDERLRAVGVDVFLLASGVGDGHVAFNPPGTPRQAGSRIIELADSTRRDNLATFPDFRGLDDVPRNGVSVGVATIAEVSRRAVLIATGAERVQAVARIAAADRYDPNWPATILADCASPSLYVDVASAPPSVPESR